MQFIMLFQSTMIGQLFILSICFLPQDIRGEKLEMKLDPFPHDGVWCSGGFFSYCNCSEDMCNNSQHCYCDEAQAEGCCNHNIYEPTWSPPEGSVMCESDDGSRSVCDCDWMCLDKYDKETSCSCEEAQECCEGKTVYPTPSVPEGHVLCDGNPIWMSCDCSKNMCEYLPEICGCEEAQECCEDATSWPTYSPPEGSIVCEGNGPMEYCGCSVWECEDYYFDYHFDYCGCEEAQKCCEEAKASFSPPEGSVVCEGNDVWEYCDCSDWECNHSLFGSMYCSCEEALECCEGATSWPTWTWDDGEEKDDKMKVKVLR